MNKKQQASLETSKKILAIARKHFSLKGYAETSLEEIVDELGMTRGRRVAFNDARMTCDEIGRLVERGIINA